MQRGPKPAELQLSEEERDELEALVQRHSSPQQLAKRERMILGAAEGKGTSDQPLDGAGDCRRSDGSLLGPSTK
jgi:hypothetical protein